ncbi:DinB family protein, partial [Candidatus Bathyarchaeota archaeon]|nr:DinB family protein [Candidatus Bathyarchaeota archaeon]
LDELVHYEIASRGMSSDNQRWQLLMHIVNHATDHRAQILVMLDNHFSLKTVEHDMVFYFWEVDDE